MHEDTGALIPLGVPFLEDIRSRLQCNMQYLIGNSIQGAMNAFISTFVNITYQIMCEVQFIWPLEYPSWKKAALKQLHCLTMPFPQGGTWEEITKSAVDKYLVPPESGNKLNKVLDHLEQGMKKPPSDISETHTRVDDVECLSELDRICLIPLPPLSAWEEYTFRSEPLITSRHYIAKES